MHDVDGFVYLGRATFVIRTEVRVGDHGHDRSMVEELDCFFGQFSDINQCLGVRMPVNQCICQEISAFLGVQDVHGTEMLVLRTDADYLLGYLDGVGVFSVQTGNESISFSGFYHHHTEVVAFEHLVVRFLEVGALAGTLLGKDTGITFTARSFVRMAEVDNLDTFQT